MRNRPASLQASDRENPPGRSGRAIADSTLAVALAGGAGAVVGTLLGQGLQIWRDKAVARIEDRRRVQDRRSENYVAIIGRLRDLKSAARAGAEGIRLWTLESPTAEAMAQESWKAFVESVEANIAPARALALVNGSDEVIRAFSALDDNLMGVFTSSDLDRKIWRAKPEYRDGAALDAALQAVKRSGQSPLPSVFEPVVQSIAETAPIYFKLVTQIEDDLDAVVHLLRMELGLTIAEDAGYLRDAHQGKWE